MPIDLKSVAGKIQRFRAQLDLSVTELSAGTGIPEDLLLRYETAEKEPTGDHILVLSDYFRCDYRFLISNEPLAPFEQTEELYRKHSNEFSKADRRNVQDFLYLCENEEYLTRILSRDQGMRPFTYVKKGTYYKGHGIDAAAELRAHLRYEAADPIENIYGDLREIGIHVFRRKLGNSNISGIFIRHPSAGECVLVNYSEDIFRQRFTAAHEAAHAILDDDQDVVVSFVGWERKDLVEIRANAFASRYIVPPTLIEQVGQESGWDADIGAKWAKTLGVSTRALANALDDAGVAARKTLADLRRKRVSREAKRDPEISEGLPEPARRRKQEQLERGLSEHYVDLCFDAYKEGVISRGRLAECLLLDDRDLEGVARLYGRSVEYGD